MYYKLTTSDLNELDRAKLSKGEYDAIQRIINRRISHSIKAYRTIAFIKEKIYSLPSYGGVYGIFHLDKCIYIGETINFKDRALTHFRDMVNKKNEMYQYMYSNQKYIRFGVISIASDKEQRAILEQFYINKYKDTIFNIQGVKTSYVRPSK